MALAVAAAEIALHAIVKAIHGVDPADSVKCEQTPPLPQSDFFTTRTSIPIQPKQSLTTFCEATHLRSSTPHPSLVLEWNISATWRAIPWIVYTTTNTANLDWNFDELIPKTFKQKTATPKVAHLNHIIRAPVQWKTCTQPYFDRTTFTTHETTTAQPPFAIAEEYVSRGNRTAAWTPPPRCPSPCTSQCDG